VAGGGRPCPQGKNPLAKQGKAKISSRIKNGLDKRRTLTVSKKSQPPKVSNDGNQGGLFRRGRSHLEKMLPIGGRKKLEKKEKKGDELWGGERKGGSSWEDKGTTRDPEKKITYQKQKKKKKAGAEKKKRKTSNRGGENSR